MKRLCIFLLSCSALACAADLAGVHSVYILPMRSGLDQYLANRLTNGAVWRVVTDPKLADAVITDHIGEAFQAQLEDMSPAPKDPEPIKKVSPTPAPASPPAKKAKDDAPTLSEPLIDTETKAHELPRTSTFGHSRGTVFLVDQKSRQVLWSVYETPKGTESKEMDRTASDIVSRIKKDLGTGK